VPGLIDGIDAGHRAELDENVAQVALDRRLGQGEPGSDLPVAQRLPDQPEDLAFAHG
jgi:hypothetical protein